MLEFMNALDDLGRLRSLPLTCESKLLRRRNHFFTRSGRGSWVKDRTAHMRRILSHSTTTNSDVSVRQLSEGKIAQSNMADVNEGKIESTVLYYSTRHVPYNI